MRAGCMPDRPGILLLLLSSLASRPLACLLPRPLFSLLLILSTRCAHERERRRRRRRREIAVASFVLTLSHPPSHRLPLFLSAAGPVSGCDRQTASCPRWLIRPTAHGPACAHASLLSRGKKEKKKNRKGDTSCPPRPAAMADTTSSDSIRAGNDHAYVPTDRPTILSLPRIECANSTAATPRAWADTISKGASPTRSTST